MLPLRLLISIFILDSCFSLVNAGFGFLKDQRQCQLKCQNHGVCAYEIGKPRVHRCICMQNMYYGDLCQFSVTSPPPTQRILITTTQTSASEPQRNERPIKIVPQSMEDSVEDAEGEQQLEQEKSSYLTLEDAEKKSEELEEASDKSVEIEKNDDYFEPSIVETPAASTELHPDSAEAETNSGGHVVLDNQIGQYQSKKQKTTHSVERDNVVEEEESWMMVKKKSNSASTFNLYHLVLTALSLSLTQLLFH